MKLYKLETAGLGDYWVLGNDSAEAEIKLSKMLEEASYGFYKDRRIHTIHIIAESADDKRFLTDKKLVP